MSNAALSPIGSPASPPSAATAPAKDPRAAKIHHAAAEFESMLVKQMLQAAHMGRAASGGDGEEKSGGYADMAVDALASAIERGGGLGLAKRIEQALGGHAAPQASPPVSPAMPNIRLKVP